MTAAVAEAIKRDLAISDFQLGLLQGLGFAVLYSIAGYLIALLSTGGAGSASSRRQSASGPSSPRFAA